MLLTQLPIKSIKIGRDRLTQTSRGVCYVEMNSVVDAMFLHNQLLGEPPSIDEKLVSFNTFTETITKLVLLAQKRSCQIPKIITINLIGKRELS